MFGTGDSLMLKQYVGTADSYKPP